jgi:phosphotransferase system IIB component
VKSCQPVALTRLRVELRDAGLLQSAALRLAGVQAVMPLENGVVHLLLGVSATP